MRFDQFDGGPDWLGSARFDVIAKSANDTSPQTVQAMLQNLPRKGHYLAPYARLLLAIASLRDQDRSTAKKILTGLVREFPQNGRYQAELARLRG